MKYIVIAVRDRAADVYGVPMFVASRGGAIRSFADEINRPADGNVYAKHPEDFDLFEVGTFDDNSCSFDLLDRPLQIAVGKDLVVRA